MAALDDVGEMQLRLDTCIEVYHKPLLFIIAAAAP